MEQHSAVNPVYRRRDGLRGRCARTWVSTWPLLIAAIVAVGLAGCGQAYLSARTVAPTPAPPTAVPTATADTLPTPAPPSDPWIPLKSHSAADILAAVRQAPFLQVVAGAPPGSDGYFDVSHLGTPMLVLAYRVPPHYQGVVYLSAAKRPRSLARGMHGLSVCSPLCEKSDLYGRLNGASLRRSTVP